MLALIFLLLVNLVDDLILPRDIILGAPNWTWRGDCIYSVEFAHHNENAGSYIKLMIVFKFPLLQSSFGLVGVRFITGR